MCMAKTVIVLNFLSFLFLYSIKMTADACLIILPKVPFNQNKKLKESRKS